MKTNKQISCALLALTATTLNSIAAIVSVDIDQINTVSATNSSLFYRFEVLDELINSTPVDFSNPSSVTTVSELTVFDRVERAAGLTGSNGAYVDLQEDSSDSNLVEIFLYPMNTGHSTHKLGITIDFELDPDQIISNFTFDGGNLWSTPDPSDVIPVVAITNGGTSISIDYQFTVVPGVNPGGQQTMSSTTSFDSFTLTLSSVPVPEPTSPLLIATGSLLLLRRRRERI